MDRRGWRGPTAARRSGGDAGATTSVGHPGGRESLAHSRPDGCRIGVGHSAAVSLDVCGSCSGIWFDRNEWHALKARGLHDDLHQVATEPWQAEVRREETRAGLEALYRRRYGADYDELARVRRWPHAHPERQSILAFLADSDPFLV